MKKYLFVIILFLLFIVNINKIRADDTIYNRVSDATEIESAYSFSPRYNPYVENDYKYGNMHECNRNCHNEIKGFHYIEKNEVDNYGLGDVSITYPQVGVYQGKSVDMIIKLESIEFNGNDKAELYFYDNQIGLATWASKDGNSDNRGNTNFNFTVTYTYSDNSNNDPIPEFFKNNVSFTDLDKGERIGIMNHKDHNIYKLYTYMKDNSYKNYNHFDVEKKILPNDTMYYFTGTDRLSMKCEKKDDFTDATCKGGSDGGPEKYRDISGDGNFDLSAEEIYNSDLYKKFEKSGMLTVLIKKANFSFSWNYGYVGFTDAGFLRLKEPEPEKYVSKDGNNFTKDTINAFAGDTVYYKIIQEVPNQPSTFKYNYWRIEDTLPEEIENYEIVSVTDCQGNNKIEQFNGLNDSDDLIINNKFFIKVKGSERNNSNKSVDIDYNSNYCFVIAGTVKENSSVTIENFASHVYEISNSSGNLNSNYVYIKTSDMTCENSLQQIKNNSFTYGKVKTINELIKLYEIEDGNFNMLLNYKINGDNLNLDNVSCENVSCDVNINSKLACSENSSILATTSDSNVENRVCSTVKVGALNNNPGSFIYDNSLYCSVNYEFKLPFNYDKFKAGELLWKNSSFDDLEANVKCFGSVREDKKIDSLDFDKFSSDINPNINISWGLDNEDINFTYIGEDNNNSSECFNGICYLEFDNTYKYSLNFKNEYYGHVITGILEKSGNIVDKSEYEYVGYGLPIINDEELGLKNATVTFSAMNFNLSKNCPYNVVKGVIYDNKYEFLFRVIDTSNPFAGIDGSNTRLTGSNWCFNDDCSSDNDLVSEKIIYANNSYSNEPMYSFVLTPNDIQEIRNYNEGHSYDDISNLHCDSGNNCISEFLTEFIINHQDNSNYSCYNDRMTGHWCGN